MNIDIAGHIKAEKNYGDIDMRAVDHAMKIIYAIECKNILSARNGHEMKVEMDLYLGRTTDDDSAKIKLHLKRDEFLRKYPEKLNEFLKIDDGYQLVSFILTADEIPLAFIKKEQLPLPVRSFVSLRKDKDSFFLRLNEFAK